MVDTILDIGFIAYDVFDIGRSVLRGDGVSGTQWASLGADVGGAFVPFLTGGGSALRLAKGADAVAGVASAGAHGRSGRIFNIARVGNLDLTERGVKALVERNAQRIESKVGQKLGQGRLPFERSRRGFDEAVETIRNTLGSATDVSGPFTSARGGNQVIDVFSKDTGFTVRLRTDGSFDTLIQGPTARVRP